MVERHTYEKETAAMGKRCSVLEDMFMGTDVVEKKMLLGKRC
jgi:hypothetical protein